MKLEAKGAHNHLSPNPVKDVKSWSNALSSFLQFLQPACFPTATQKHLKIYLLGFWRGKAGGCSSDGGPGFSVPTQETSQLCLNGST